MHIALYSPGWPANEFTNGIVTYIHYLRTELIRQGHEVSVFTTVIGRTNRDAGIYLVRHSPKSFLLMWINRHMRRRSSAFGWGIAIARAVCELHRTQSIDVLEMEESFGWCADVRDRVPFPVVVKLHGPAFLVEADHGSKRIADKIAAEGEGLRRVGAIVSPSRNTLESTLARYGLHPAISRTIPNPIALEAGCEPWDLDRCDGKTILFVGRFDRLKGGDAVLLAFRRLLDVDAGLKLVFVGPDVGLAEPDGSTVNFNAFCESLFDEAQRRSISYLGKLPRSEIGALRARAMLTLVVSQWENQPNTALEAMIQGCPIVGYDSGGMGEVIEHGVTGLLARTGDIDDLCTKTLELLRDPARARELGRNAAVTVASRHSVSALAQQAVVVYREALARAGAPGK